MIGSISQRVQPCRRATSRFPPSRLRKKNDLCGEERKNVPQGLKAEGFYWVTYGLKPVPTFLLGYVRAKARTYLSRPQNDLFRSSLGKRLRKRMICAERKGRTYLRA